MPGCRRYRGSRAVVGRDRRVRALVGVLSSSGAVREGCAVI